MGLELVSKEDIDVKVSKQAPLEDNVPVYTGTEHRLNVRRNTVDRREMVRFEEKADRRSGKERRITNHMWNGRDL